MKRKALLSLFLCVLMLLALPVSARADGAPAYRLVVWVDGQEKAVRCYDESYDGNLYLSLTDLAAALSGSARQFRLSYNNGEKAFHVHTGQAASSAGNADQAGWKYGVSYLNLRRNRLYVDGAERRYYTYAEGTDLYMSLADIQLMLDVQAAVYDDGSVLFDPSRSYAADVPALAEDGFFDLFNAVLLGDADTGELFFYKDPTVPYPIASLSKLMTYLLLCEAQDNGEISFSDMVSISAEAARLSGTADSMVSLHEGSAVPFRELLTAMLLASSNEAALALAQHAAGSEAAFVARMNARADELGLRSACFYSPHGLPDYGGRSVPIKRQNSMSARDLFHLASYLMEHYPELTNTTSLQYASMPSLDYTTANSNPLVFNLPGCNGLKTGSTVKAGSCLAASLPVTVEGETHTLVAVVLGAESADVRGQAAEILLRYGRALCVENGFGREAA